MEQKKRRRRYEGDDFYRYPRWRRARREALTYYHCLCQECKRRGKVTRATLVHHHVPRKERPDLAYELFLPDGTAQLVPLCFDCHERIETERGNRPSGRHIKDSDEWF